MRRNTLPLLMALVLSAPAIAQERFPSCEQRIASVADRIPDLGEGQAATKELGISKEHLQAALAALDAARIAQAAGSRRGCLDMADAAAAMLTEGGVNAPQGQGAQ